MTKNIQAKRAPMNCAVLYIARIFFADKAKDGKAGGLQKDDNAVLRKMRLSTFD